MCRCGSCGLRGGPGTSLAALVQSVVGRQLKRSGAGGGKGGGQRKSVLRNIDIFSNLGTSNPLLLRLPVPGSPSDWRQTCNRHQNHADEMWQPCDT
ncbi:unnamed protein product [Arctogadus glacialis]